MSDRVQLGWHVPIVVWERFEADVEAKFGSNGPYERFALEVAIREYIDDDTILAEAERLLREQTDARALSSSTVLVGTGRYQGEPTKKLMHRVDRELKERFTQFADEHDARSYGRALAAALDTYTDGGRDRRILEHARQLADEPDTPDSDGDGPNGGTADPRVENRSSDSDVSTAAFSTASQTGTTPDTSSAETTETDASTATDTAESATPAQPQRIDRGKLIAIAESLPNETMPKSVVHDTITAELGTDEPAVVERYREAVLEHIGAGEHPHRDDIYLTDTYRESQCLWADLSRSDRIVLLRCFAAAEAVDNTSRTATFDYREVMEVFEHNAGGGGPSHQYAYELMEAAGEAQGFEYGKYHGQYQLRVDIDRVEESVLHYALEDNPQTSREELAYQGVITSYGASQPGTTQAAGDD
ncbi:hypothetical protein [Halosegnis longus]|uniref:hypothetical protein n=1 Tax=Halosegnis longus TaxID=2216012 RepID=UPI00117EEE4E|nr:hypothetical protein [Salella cibi]